MIAASVLAEYGIGYAWAGWGACAAAGSAYVAWLLRRGRRAAAQVPEGQRRWSDPS